MGRFAVVMLVCLLAALSGCQADVQDNQITELAYEDLTGVERDALQDSENSTASVAGSQSVIYMALTQLGALEERLSATMRALEETNKKLEASERKVSELDSAMSQMSQGQPRVAFSAALPTTTTIGPVNVLYSLVYKSILYNSGGHYSPVTGFFTAPVPGVYYFAFSSFDWQSGSTTGGSLYHNENKLVSWYGYSRNQPISGSNSAVIQLRAGDKVNVRLWDTRRISDNGSRYCSFSGFLLFTV